jgi:hypothetical protein
VLETAEGNYLRPVWNFRRRSNYSEQSRDGFIRIEVGQTRRACRASRFVLPRNASFSRPAREKERERERERERGGGGGGRGVAEFRAVGLHQTGITHIRLA